MNFSSYYRSKDSFTLVELLVVIGILAILTAAVVIVLNPAELLKQSRDSKRTTDLAALNNALKILLTQNPEVSLGAASTVYVSLADSSSTCGSYSLPALPNAWKYNCVAAASLTKTDGSGWIPVNFSNGASQLPALPADPQNDANTRQYYTYATANGRWELASNFESAKYAIKEAADGGTNPAYYEMGPATNLISFVNGLVGYWAFDGDSSNLTGLGGNGIWSGTGTHYAAGKVGQAGQFNGTNDYVTSAFDLGILKQGREMGSFSISVWAKPSQVFTAAEKFLGGRVGCHGGITAMDGGRFSFQLASSDCWVNGTFLNTDAIPDYANWHHVAGVYDQKSMKIYVDGTLANKGTFRGTSLYAYGDNFYMGGDSSARFFSGLIDDLRVYGRALSDAEVQAIYNASK
jgi:type II secretory pathway pseudopilin PulG